MASPKNSNFDANRARSSVLGALGTSSVFGNGGDPSDRRRRVMGMQAMTEALRDRLARAQQFREMRKHRITDTMRHLFKTVGMLLDIPVPDVEEYVLDEGKHLDLLDEFVEKDGRRALMFFHQDSEIPSAEDTGRTYRGHHTKGQKVCRLFITDGADEPLTGSCLYFLKCCPEELTINNLDRILTHGQLECSEESDVSQSLHQALVQVYLPMLKANQNWGQLKAGTEAQKTKNKLMENFDRFLHVLSSASRYASNTVTLRQADRVNVSDIRSAQDCIAAAGNAETVAHLEEVVSHWCKQISQVLTESEQIRREADDTGPLAELEHWRQLNSRFNSILEQLKGHECRTTVNVLNIAKSKVMLEWRKLDNRITDAANEAKDNTKYLYTLEKYCEPLYRSDPVGMLEHIPSLMNAIKMIYTVSRYYNTSERMTAVFSKVTNQMVKTCKTYLMEDDNTAVLQQPADKLLSKIQDCINLYRAYQLQFRKTKQRSEESGEKSFDFSEMYIFGKFEALSKRLHKIVELLQVVQAFSELRHYSHMEGLDVIYTKFQDIYETIRNRKYNALDYRKYEFDTDYAEFRSQIANLEKSIAEYLDTSLAQRPTTIQAVNFLVSLEHLNLKSLDMEVKFEEVLMKLGRDIEYVKKLYNKEKENPLIQRDMPPIAGRIAWARQLKRKIQVPMMIYRKRQHLLKSPEAQKVVRYYNKVALCLVDYETRYYRAWVRSVDLCKKALQVPVLVRDWVTGALHVNLDPEVHTLVREAEWMRRLGLDIPESAGILTYLRTKLKQDYDQLCLLVEEVEAVQSRIPPIFVPLMKKRLKHTDTVIHPGCISLTWTSLNLPLYFSQVKAELNTLDRLTKKIIDMKELRIDDRIQEISDTLLSKVPDDTPWTVDEFLEETRSHCKDSANNLNNLSQRAMDAVLELIGVLEEESGLFAPPEPERNFSVKSLDDSAVEGVSVGEEEMSADEEEEPSCGCDMANLSDIEEAERIRSSGVQSMKDRKKGIKEEEERRLFEEDSEEVFGYFSHRCLDALVKATKYSLDVLRRKVTMPHGGRNVGYRWGTNNSEEIILPLFSVDMALEIPNIVMQPNVDEVQHAVNRAAQMILGVSRSVNVWVNPRLQVDETEVLGKMQMKNYYRCVMDHKDVNKLMVMLSSPVVSSQGSINSALREYSQFNFLWEEDRDNYIQKFTQTEPSLSEYRTEIERFEEFDAQVDDIAPAIVKGTIQLNTEPMKYALKIEIRAWQMLLFNKLNNLYREKMVRLTDYVEETSLRLNRDIKDLDDVRHAMAALESVRQHQIQFDMELGPIEESYMMLQKRGVAIPQEEINKVDTMRHSFQMLLEKATRVHNELVEAQQGFREKLLFSVEQFIEDVNEFEESYTSEGPMEEGISAEEANNRMIRFQSKFDDMWHKYQAYSTGERLFGMTVTEYPFLEKVKKELGLQQKLYGLYNKVMKSISGYYDILWKNINIEQINEELQDFLNSCRKLPKGLKEWQAYNDLNERIRDFSESCPLLEMMSYPAMKDRHWDRIAQCTGHTFHRESGNFALKHIMQAPLLQHKEDIEDICISAVKEKDIEAKLKQVIAEWDSQNVTLAHFKNRGELLLKGSETSEIIAQMEDSLMVLGSLMSNRYNTPFRKSIQTWLSNLTNSTEILETWMIVQNLWVYLEAVFVGGDIAKQLPQEAKRFGVIDKSWLRIMDKAHEVPNVVQCCVGDETLGQMLPHLLEQLELCQKSLTGYLEAKRLVFPRFFFVSDPALLEILGQASDPHTIQAHLTGIFDNVKSVEFSEKKRDNIKSVLSREGEKIQLDKQVVAEGKVEVWLGDLLTMQQRSLLGVIREANDLISEPKFELLKFIDDHIAQVGLLGLQIIWTQDSEYALRNSRTERRIMQTTNHRFLSILNQLIHETTRDLSKFERIKFETLITIHVHQRDIFNDLVRMHIRSVTDFEWLKQARFYFQADSDHTLVRITDVNFVYQNEFIGCTDRLVITPLTDRCYITLAQALGMCMGGAPAGPAGTGKTETVKDMGKALGKYVVVFNCSDQMDFRGLGRIFKGLAQSGSWGCFDEFNRITLPVLSVAAQQIYIVLQAKKEMKTEFLFSDGDVVPLNPEFGLLLTMNPGYAGRQELPENLKVQFRTVAMMVPDKQIIMRVKLASCGFQENVILAQKFFVLYKLCEEQLSKQVHYDFGLRNILSVLRTLGANKRARPEDSESAIVMRVLRDMNVSKLVDEDEPLFLSLIADLFPGIHLDNATYGCLQAAIELRVQNAKLINHPTWNLKLVQLFETQRVRHGMMTLGPSGAGKTCCIQTLMKAMSDCGGAQYREMRMNPKAITAPQMFGRLDVATNDWTDGIFSTLWRRTLRCKKGEHIWIVLDGPIDAVWVENLNSVLDDSQMLTLANGDRIPMAPTCKIIFEVHNIDNASPATVSRNGMVFMNASALDWRPILQGWLNHRPQLEAQFLLSLFDKIFEDLYNFAVQNLNAKMNVLQSMQIMQACNLLEGLIPHGDDKSFVAENHLEKIVIFSLMWSIGALMELDDRQRLETFFVSHKSKLALPPTRPGETIFEYVVDKKGQWEHWSRRVEQYVYPTDSVPEFSKILVPNVDNVRTNFLIDTIAKQHKAVLLIGEQGTAKTVMIKADMSGYNSDQHLSKSFNFSSATTPLMFQRTIESFVDKRVGNQYGPPAGRKMTCFIDDINMPKINEWGDQVTNEITRQMMEMKGMYSLEKPGEFTTIVDIQFIAAMIQPGGGRNDIPERLKRHFSIFNCALPSNSSIDQIFSVIGEGYFCRSRFNDNIVELVKLLVPATKTLWQQTKTKMLPTPAKFHYVFNLRDLSRIWQGMLHVTSAECNTAETLLALWKHECTRVIADRFTNQDDKNWFLSSITRVLKEEVGEKYADMLVEEPYFVDFLRDAPEATGEEDEDADFKAPKVYEQIPNYDILKDRLTKFLHAYNEATRGANMDLVFFVDAMVHLVKISRIIRTARGNALLVGVGGSGKQSLTRLASFIAGYKSFQITLTRSYNVGNLMEDLKGLYRLAGFEGKGVTFIFTDNEIKDEAFLEYINNVLSSGEVSNLFPRDELNEITQELVPVMKAEFPRRPATPENLYDYFISRARSNLHVVLCLSPGEKFRTRSLKFPGLISGCTMDWFSRWPRDALIAVSKHFLSSFPIVCTQRSKDQLVDLMGHVHYGVIACCTEYFGRFRRQTHVTPKSYLAFINGYKTIYNTTHKAIGELSARMNTGLQKLIEASESVDRLSKQLVVKEKDLEVANKKADQVLVEVTQSAQAAEKVKVSVQEVKDRAQLIVDEINAERNIAENKLEAAEPALEAAEAALQTIQAVHIATVRKLAKPPHLIMRIMDTVMILFRKNMSIMQPDPERHCPKPSWNESLKMMAGSGFLHSLMTFPKDTINDETVEFLEPYLAMEDFNLDTAKRVCGDVAGLCSWVQAMAIFYGINKEVLPLKANLAVQENRLAAATKELKEAQAELDEKQRELDAAQAEYDAAMKEKQHLVDDANACRRKMGAATKLISGLGGEKVRWTEQSKELQEQIERLVGDVLVLTGFLSYSGPFNQEFRTAQQTNWSLELSSRGIPYTDRLNVNDMLVDNNTIVEWSLQGLPSDELSIQNGIIVTQATRYPLLIDPQGQGKTWIKNREKKKGLQVTSLNHKYFKTHLEDALSLGKPLLLEDVGQELDPCLDNILEKNFIKSGSRFKVKVGDKECDMMKGFYLYITTKLANPSYTPEVSAKTSIIDFTVTREGLEDQLLGRVILTEKQELEAEKVHLMKNVTANKRRMKELEDNLLYKLTSTKGALVDDPSVIEVLNVTKETAADVSEKLAVAAETEIKINKAREEFRRVASRGSILYFLICEMSMVNCMYQTSLVQFLQVFDRSMERSEKSPNTCKRIGLIIEYLTFEAFSYTCRGLYETHKFLFTLQLALKISLDNHTIRHQEFEVLIKGGAALDLKAVEHKPAHCKWINDTTWLNLVQLSKLPQFHGILSQVTGKDKEWRKWFDTDAPEEEVAPDSYIQSLDTFRKLLFIRSWCPDRTVAQARKYIAEALGERYVEAVMLNFTEMWSESDPRSPLICLLSMGSEPTKKIQKLARKLGIESRAISMGQGQEVHARRLIAQFMTDGGWALLQNCHLGLNFMDELLETVTSAEKIHNSFRVWITTDVHPNFPISLLQASIKFTNEPPHGVKAGLKRTYAGITQDFLEISNMHQWRPMLYAVSFLHTVVQERRKFGPLGWNIPYEFNSSDWTASVQFFQNHLDDMDIKKGVSWNTVRYMLGEVQYGGRVTDDYDKRLLNTFAKVWFGENMFEPTFEFYQGYGIPPHRKVEEYAEFIESLPATDSPQVFGLHPNADITFQSNLAKEVLDTIISIQPKDCGGVCGETRETVVHRMAGEMLNKLPADYVPHEVRDRLKRVGLLQPLVIFLRQEIDRMQRVISVVRSTLTDLQLAIEGTIIMNENLRDALDNMYDARVPALWRRVSWESSTIGFWFTELLERNEQFHRWVFEGRPHCFWMTGFFNPQGFLTAMRQEVTRAHKGWSLDDVMLHNDVTSKFREDIRAAPAEGVFIHGLSLDGASWDRRNGKLTEPHPKILFTALPVVHMYATQVGHHDLMLYHCPVYKKPKRTNLNYITDILLKTDHDPDHWILRGAAALCDTK